MKITLALLPSDWIVYGLFIACIIGVFWIRRKPHLSEPWGQVFKNRIGMITSVVLAFYIAVALLDSLHFNVTTQDNKGHYTSIQQESLLDLMVGPLNKNSEKTYSKPFATHLYQQSLVTLPNGKEIRAYPRLKHAATYLKKGDSVGADILIKILIGFLIGLVSFLCISALWILFLKNKRSYIETFKRIFKGKTRIAWREAIITTGIMWILISILAMLAIHYHVFGTDKIGHDVFYETIKSIRTGLLIGTLTTLFMLPFALVFGTIAGYFSGFIDDVIQYLYTTLSSIPGVLLISAMILVMQVYIANHPQLFPSIAERADARLLALCLILGITTWASLCRLLRAETLKIREHDFVTAAIALGSRKRSIIFRHVLPNVMHIVLITMVLDFSGLVLAEAILSYVGVGVDPTMASWGNMINSSRLELAREPMVWWPLLASLTFMFFLVLAANLFADSVRDAFDPRLRDH